ncbi:methyltransferase domain-containing protein [Parapedobacter tibetensis]|uniref:methyltransferase domain-containing protein n=1 Tax=Parapedobacter tibetensis TaxID=2972951 RepID=UPI00214D5E47|nr:methyltransferase domain-containing protein [Parapedobacter tibetensis]
MEQIRKPLQGVSNIIRFNWHFYLLAAVFVAFFFLLNMQLPEQYQVFGNVLCLLIIASTIISLLISMYVYDLSGFYQLHWMDELGVATRGIVVNIHAGFDETSASFQYRCPNAVLTVLDFYDPSKHTEISIRRARKAYPPYPGTQQISTADVSLPDDYADMVFVIFSAHEIRDNRERSVFFSELKRILSGNGKIIVTEHLRDVPNFLAYNIGFFHFYPKVSWRRIFKQAGLRISKELKITPFITSFVLEKHGIEP